MSSIYLHIPFCKKACHYCDFYFSTSLKYKDTLLEAMHNEINLRTDQITQPLKAIYFGGGTPSILQPIEIESFLNIIYKNFKIDNTVEITLEANPDDLTAEKVKALSQLGINRLSIGIQSFFEQDLALMNRAHNVEQAYKALELSRKWFENITIDLIYGMPQMTSDKWLQNIQTALDFDIPHISSYALTVEERTALDTLVKRQEIIMPEDDSLSEQFFMLKNTLENKGYTHYEFSNFGKEGYWSVNNLNYWLGNNYLGIGPSAHSLYQNIRSWNHSNNILYIKSLSNNQLALESETLSLSEQYNEYIMTRLRTIFGVNSEEVREKFGKKFQLYFDSITQDLIKKGFITYSDKNLCITTEYKFLTDGISSSYFYV
ncbi:MAG: radical SAM family heme chaperone HemW [Bacteroidota bacterium]|nr:radical SAM family heme chaperone HemW [Bacteroidota bacterium]